MKGRRPASRRPVVKAALPSAERWKIQPPAAGLKAPPYYQKYVDANDYPNEYFAEGVPRKPDSLLSWAR